MTQTHPITPPPELVQQWWAEETYDPFGVAISKLATQAAQWGANQELEACAQWVEANFGQIPTHNLHQFRRPNPPSLKEQALAAQQRMWDGTSNHDDWNLIRRALEQLPDAHYSPRTGGPR